MPRKSRQVETRMVSEYLISAYPQYHSITAVPLGMIDNALMAKEGYQKAIGLSRPYRPEADAVVILPGALLLIEAKVWNVVNGLAKLPLYKSLVPVTPELIQYKALPIIMELVVGWTNANLEQMARGSDVRVKIYCPPWLGEVVTGMHNYWTADYQRERQRKIDARKLLGLE
jgi:hypothetical protein